MSFVKSFGENAKVLNKQDKKTEIIDSQSTVFGTGITGYSAVCGIIIVMRVLWVISLVFLFF